MEKRLKERATKNLVYTDVDPTYRDKLRVEKRLKERATKNLVYTDVDLTYRELVLCLNLEGDEVYVGIYGYIYGK